MPRLPRPAAVLLVAAAVLGTAGVAVATSPRIPNLFPFANPTGVARTLTLEGSIDPDQPFFQALGTNGRSCASCHVPADGFSITPAGVRARFEASGGLDPIFRPHDGADSPAADVSSVPARREAYSMLLTKGLIRIGLPVPPDAEFRVTAVDDPYGFASAAELSLFRRPLPATNLVFLSGVMWDGRETASGETIHFDLANQASTATVGHAQGAPLTAAQRQRIVRFEAGLFTAQSRDVAAHALDANGGRGDAKWLSRQPFFLGMNDPFGPDPGAFDRQVFRLFDGWASATGRFGQARRAVARGQTIFNERLFGPGARSTCSTCHNTPGVGTSSTNTFFNLGTSDGVRRTPDLPLYTLQCIAGPMIGQTFTTTDPGLALVTGRCRDVGRFKVPGLRGLAARAPYFHDGSAATLADVVEFYDTVFAIGLTPGERADLVAFLRAL
jgi:cytochrome c peroxidase